MTIQNELNDQLYNAVEARDEARVFQLLAQGASARHNDSICLRFACDLGEAEMVAALLDHGADVNAEEGRPLYWASRNGHPGIARLLIARGADVHLEQEDALFTAIQYGQLKLVILLAGHSPDWGARDGDLAREAYRQWIHADYKNDHVKEILALVSCPLQEQEGFAEKACRSFRGEAERTASSAPRTRKRALIDARGEATPALRQHASAQVLDAYFAPEHWPDPKEALAFYRKLEKALPDHLVPALQSVDMTAFASAQELVGSNFVERTRLESPVIGNRR